MSAAEMLVTLAAECAADVRTIRRPADEETPEFDLAYVRTGPRTATPTVVIPGGPGLGSVLPYRRLRKWAARGGLDLIMVEHRGVGLSRRDLGGNDLPFSAMRITKVVDDIAAVLDREGARRAFVAGSSYGSYVAGGFGVRHGDRVAGMVLDSALQSTLDLEVERSTIRRLFWEGGGAVSTMVRRLIDDGEDERTMLDIARAAYELGGAGLVVPLLGQQIERRRGLTWKMLDAYATRGTSILGVPGIYEFDIAGAIGFRELNYGAPSDGHPLDPALTYAPIAHRFPAFDTEPFDLPRRTPDFPWPIVVLSGQRDLRTPPPVARRVAQTSSDGVLVTLDNGHSALDTHPAALLNTIRVVVGGRHRALPKMVRALDLLPRRGFAARLPEALHIALKMDRILARG